LEAKVSDISTTKCELGDEENSINCPNRWLAPEIPTGNFGNFSDMYAFGLVVWNYWSAKQPYEDRKNSELPPQNGTRPIITQNCPKKWINLIDRCWQQEPSRRPQFDEILETLKMLK